MSYRGTTNVITFGLGGFNALENQERVPLSDLHVAKNIRFDGDMARKAGGLTATNVNSFHANAVALAGLDYWPTKTTQKLLTVWTGGGVDIGTDTVINTNTATFGNTAPVTILKCGEEITGNNAHALFVGGAQIPMYIEGTGVTLINVANVSADWSGANWPTSAIIHDSRVVAWGNDNAQHAIYFSTLDDHLDFSTGLPPIYDIMPGKGRYITACYSLQTTRLMIFKYPVGIFMIDTQNLPSYYLPVTTVRDDIGCPSASGVAKVGSLGTWFIGADAHIYSLEAVMNPDADIVDADITSTMGLNEWIADNISTDESNLKFARLLYNPSRKEVWAIFRDKSATSNNIALIFNVKDPQAIRVSVENRGTYLNAAWLSWNSTSKLFEVYCAGSTGYVYRADQLKRSITGSSEVGYEAIVQTPSNDLGVTDINKRFDWIEVYIKSVGDYALNLDTYIDGEYYASYSFNQGTAGSYLEPSSLSEDYLAPAPGQTEFTLAAVGFIKHKLRIGGIGKTISLKFYNSGADQDFGIAKATIFFKPLGTTGEK